MPDFITTLATVPAIVALTNLGKRLGLPSRAALLLAVLLGVGLSLAQWAWAGAGWYDAAANGLILGLGAAGLYDLTPGPSSEQVGRDVARRDDQDPADG